MSKRSKFPWPHYVSEETKTVYVHVESGYPTVMGVPIKVEQYFPGYESSLVSFEYLQQLREKSNV